MCKTPIEDSTPEIGKGFKKVSVRMRQVIGNIPYNITLCANRGS